MYFTIASNKFVLVLQANVSFPLTKVNMCLVRTKYLKKNLVFTRKQWPQSCKTQQ